MPKGKTRIHPMADIRKPGLTKGVAGAAVLFWFVVWVISIISTSIPDWWWWLDSTSGVHEGLWSTCFAHNCSPTSGYTTGCMALLNVVRAFSVMTIIFSFFSFVCSTMLIFCIVKAIFPGLVFGLLAWICALITWAVYLGFKGRCVMGEQFFIPADYLAPGYTNPGYYYPFGTSTSVRVTLGSGWCLSVAAFPLAFAGWLVLVLWFVKCRKRCSCAITCPAAPPCPPPAPRAEPPEPIICPVPVPICCPPPSGGQPCPCHAPCGCCESPCGCCCCGVEEGGLPGYECCEPLPPPCECGVDCGESFGRRSPDTSAFITA